jgi:hypothetical protein
MFKIVQFSVLISYSLCMLLVGTVIGLAFIASPIVAPLWKPASMVLRPVWRFAIAPAAALMLRSLKWGISKIRRKRHAPVTASA